MIREPNSDFLLQVSECIDISAKKIAGIICCEQWCSNSVVGNEGFLPLRIRIWLYVNSYLYGAPSIIEYLRGLVLIAKQIY